MKKLLYLLWLIPIGALVLGSTATNTPVTGSPGDFFDMFFNWLWKKEGGLKYTIHGGEAAFPKAPVGQNAQGEYPHTSRGISTPVYISYHNAKGLQVDWSKWLEFATLQAPNQLWKDITTWRGREANNLSSNPILRGYLSLWYFGGWDQALVSLAQVTEILNSGDSPRTKLRKLVNLRKFYFRELVRLGRASQSTGDAWQARAEDFYDTFNNFLPAI